MANLMERFELSDKQAAAILDMRLQRLTSLEVEKLQSVLVSYLEHFRLDDFHHSLGTREYIFKVCYQLIQLEQLRLQLLHLETGKSLQGQGLPYQGLADTRVGQEQQGTRYGQYPPLARPCPT